ncbi:hypothetical protein MRB53_038861 [Persea americana]|nr:hypothetical protein MRB53_038861 [Persea americana]
MHDQTPELHRAMFLWFDTHFDRTLRILEIVKPTISEHLDHSFCNNLQVRSSQLIEDEAEKIALIIRSIAGAARSYLQRSSALKTSLLLELQYLLTTVQCFEDTMQHHLAQITTASQYYIPARDRQASPKTACLLRFSTISQSWHETKD